MLPLRTYVSDPMMRQVHFAFCDWPPERRHPPPPADNSALRLRLFCSLRCFMHLVFCSRPRLAPPLSTVRHLHRASSEFYQPGPGRTTKFSEIEYPITHTSPLATRVTPPPTKNTFFILMFCISRDIFSAGRRIPKTLVHQHHVIQDGPSPGLGCSLGLIIQGHITLDAEWNWDPHCHGPEQTFLHEGRRCFCIPHCSTRRLPHIAINQQTF
jgi:hypothetical protein